MVARILIHELLLLLLLYFGGVYFRAREKQKLFEIKN